MSTVVNAVTLVREHIAGEKGAVAAVFGTFLLWGLALLASTLLGKKIVPVQRGGGLFGRRTNNTATGAATAVEDAGVRRSSFDLERAAHRLAFGQFVSVSINEHLYGVHRSIRILAWIVFALGAFYLLLRTVAHRSGKLSDAITRVIDFIFMAIFVILWTSMWSIAIDERW